MTDKKIVVRGTLCAILGGVCWGFSGTMGQFLFSQKGLETSWVTTVRMLVAGVILLGIMAARRPKEVGRVWKTGKDARRLLLFAVLGLIPCQFTYLECIAYSNSATGTALNYLGQMMILFYVCLTTRRLPTRWELTALGLAMLGVFFLATHGNIHTLVLSPQALFWGLLGRLWWWFTVPCPSGLSVCTAALSLQAGGCFAVASSSFSSPGFGPSLWPWMERRCWACFSSVWWAPPWPSPSISRG